MQMSRSFPQSTGGGGSSIVKVPGDVPPARVYFFKLSTLVKGILFANFSPFSLGKGMLYVNIVRFWSGQGYAFWKLRSKKCPTSVIPVKNPFFSNFGPENAKIWQVLSRKCQINPLLM